MQETTGLCQPRWNGGLDVGKLQVSSFLRKIADVALQQMRGVDSSRCPLMHVQLAGFCAELGGEHEASGDQQLLCGLP